MSEPMSPPDPEAVMARGQMVRAVEALLFAAAEPLDKATLKASLPKDADLDDILEILGRTYAGRGVNLIKVGGRYAFRTAPDLAHLLERHRKEERRLSKAAVETLAVIAYHQGDGGVTRADVESVRGVQVSKTTMDLLLETGWIRVAGRKETPGRPVTYASTPEFLSHFGLASLKDLPGLDELRRAGLLEIPQGSTWGAPQEENKLPELPLGDDETPPPPLESDGR
ncbi:MAG: SMC-Scp complex subunit ScpB [Alphaproteobacteria bacterium]|nr:SMC-Scp complex subunit ScpB [Alphaproteobacteria bacterium]